MSNEIVAVSLGNIIHFYKLSGEKGEQILVKEKKVSYLQWHPRQNTLAIGYEKGQIVLYNYDQHSAKEDNEIHKDKRIVLIEYNEEGNRMISCDEKGLVVMYKGL